MHCTTASLPTDFDSDCFSDENNNDHDHESWIHPSFVRTSSSTLTILNHLNPLSTFTGQNKIQQTDIKNQEWSLESRVQSQSQAIFTTTESDRIIARFWEFRVQTPTSSLSYLFCVASWPTTSWGGIAVTWQKCLANSSDLKWQRFASERAFVKPHKFTYMSDNMSEMFNFFVLSTLITKFAWLIDFSPARSFGSNWSKWSNSQTFSAL